MKYIADGICSVCNSPAETLDLDGLQVCSDCIMIVARARAGMRGAKHVRKNGTNRTKRQIPGTEQQPEAVPNSIEPPITSNAYPQREVG
jgi:hypothetical protein